MKPGHHEGAAQKRQLGVTGGPDAGGFREAAPQITVEAVDLRGLVADEGGIDAEDHDIMRVEAEVDAAQILQRAYEQTGADEHEGGGGPLASPPARCPR